MTNRFGATPEEWLHFSIGLGMTADLLPVVSNPGATISPQSKMKALGKTPSRYNNHRHAAGIAEWTKQQTTPAQIQTWTKENDYGICIQTRVVRALDLDITDVEQAALVRSVVDARLSLPARFRGNSSKALLAFTLPGEYTKRIIRTTHGIIEFLAGGQQFVACGTHPSGAAYEWQGGLPEAFPVVEAAEFEALWAELEATFAVEPATTSKTSESKQQVLGEAIKSDPVAQFLISNGNFISAERDGRMHIICPFNEEHTSESSESATTYFPAHTNGYERGNFRCLHAHCENRERHEFLEALGFTDPDVAEFAPLVEGPADTDEEFSAVDTSGASPTDAVIPASPLRFPFVTSDEMIARKPVSWLIKGVLPKANVGVLFGESGSGKSFFALDLGAAVARGVDWCGHRTKQGKVAYICAEGMAGFRNRVEAYKVEHGEDVGEMVFLTAAPDFLKHDDVGAIIEGLRPWGRQSLIIVDTLAQVTAGANENSGEEMGKLLKHCQALSRATGALVLLIHHSGKDAAKGARGWSGIRAGCDVEIEVLRDGARRCASLTKMKDGDDGASFAFELKTVILGEDEDGEPVTSCTVEHQGKRKLIKRRQITNGNHTAVFDTFKNLLNERLDPLETTIKRTDLEEFCVKHVLQEQEEKNRKRAIKSAIEWLVANNYVQATGEALGLWEEQHGNP